MKAALQIDLMLSCPQWTASEVRKQAAASGMLSAYLAANKVGSKFICPHRHLERLVVLCWDINVPQENAAGARTVSVASSNMQDKGAAQRACP